jgi:predicted DNA-binding protein (MmcQ/YjbR family)
MDFNLARDFCSRLPGAVVETKWGSDLVFSVGKKMFAVSWLREDVLRNFSFKVDDQRFLEFTDRPHIVPAPYMARAKWIQVVDAVAMSDAEALELLQRSYQLIFSKLTKKLQREIAHE